MDAPPPTIHLHIATGPLCTMPKFAAAPRVDPSTWRTLLQLAGELQALAPWEFASDIEWVGLLDAGDREYRLANILGNAREVFAAVIYRRTGIGWLLKVLDDDFAPNDRDAVEGMDCLKVEFVTKRELAKEDLRVLKAAGFKPPGRGSRWPQFRSAIPGWHPWHIDQAEADQLLHDLPRLIAFLRLFEKNRSMFEGRSAHEVPFLPPQLPDRPLTLDDLDWRSCMRLPDPPLSPFTPPQDELDRLRKLPLTAGLVYEFDCALMPGASWIEDGKPCFGRMALLVESRSGIVIGAEAKPGGVAPGVATGEVFVSLLLRSPRLPSILLLRNPRWHPVVGGVCGALGIEVRMAKRIPALEEALSHLERMLAGGGIR